MESFSAIARIGGDFTIKNTHIIAHERLVSGYSDNTLTIIDSVIEIKNGALYEIEFDTGYTKPIISFKGSNTIIHDVDATPLIIKYTTAEPKNVFIQNSVKDSLKTNAVLNNSIPGHVLTNITLLTNNTNTY